MSRYSKPDNWKKDEVVLMWGDESDGDEILYYSDQVMIFKFKLKFDDPSFKTLESCSSHMPNICRMRFEYIHKANGYYNYIGKVERLKILCINKEIAEMEIVILMGNEGNKAWNIEYRRRYPCINKSDIYLIRGLPYPTEEKSDKISSVFV